MLEFTEQSHEYRNDGVLYPSVTTILKEMGFYGNAPDYFTEESRDRGRFVHKIIEYHLAGELDESSIDPSLEGYFKAWLKFESDTGFVPEASEKRMAANLYRFAGTLDLLGPINGHRSILDVKTGAVLPVVGIQLAAYEILEGRPTKRFGLQLKKDGKYSLKEFKDRQDKGIFLAALSVYRWQKNNLR